MPQSVYRRGSGDAALAANAVATDTPAVFAVLGQKRVEVQGRAPTGSWTIDVYLGPVSGGTLALVASFTCTVAVPLNASVDIAAAELGKLVLTNGASAQSPEVHVALADDA